jgi:hypothetical protein
MDMIFLEFESYAHLPFPSRKHLPQRSEWAVDKVLSRFNGSGVLAIEDVE